MTAKYITENYGTVGPCKTCQRYNCTTIHYNYQDYTPWTPLNGLDHKKWPNTYSLLLKWWTGRDWYTFTKWVPTLTK